MVTQRDIECDGKIAGLTYEHVPNLYTLPVNGIAELLAAHVAQETKVLREALEQWKAKAAALPMGHEDKTHGASTYNHMMAAYRFFDAALANTTKKEV